MSQPGHVEPGEPGDGLDPRAAGTAVVVRRNAGLAALIGAGASAIAIAYLWRATSSAAPLDWALCGLMAVVAAVYLANLVDARTPLLVADDLGVRIRFGNQWRSMPWDAVGTVVVKPRRGLVRDGRLMFAPHSLARALDGLDSRGRRAAALNQKVYGAALAVPMGLTTRVSAHGQALADDLTALAQGRAEVLVIEPEKPTEEIAEAVEITEPPVGDTIEPVEDITEPVEDTAALDEDRPVRRSMLGGLGMLVSRAGKGRSRDVDADRVVQPEPAAEPDAAVPLRDNQRALRAEVVHEMPVHVFDDLAPVAPPPPPPPGTDSRVRPISTLGDPVEALVIDDFAVEPAYNPVIGPELAAARNRVGLSVDELAERTRIRPHVIESIEVDDFAPCGGDFYARGHLRTLARVLGRDPAPLLEQFDNRYATAPINARRVFEAELATGMTGSMRSTVGGPNWALLVGVVLALVMTWGVVRLFAAEPQEQLQSPAPSLNGSAGVDSTRPSGGLPVAAAPKPIRLTLIGAQDESHVVVRDRTGKVVWAGDIVLGEKRLVRAAPPVRVQAKNAGAIEASVNGSDKGPLGELGQPGRRTFLRP